MNASSIKQGLRHFSEMMSFQYPAMGWYFSAEEIDGSFVFTKDKWVCMFMFWKIAMTKGQRMRFSEEHGSACVGPAEYCGYREVEDDDGKFIADVEHFKLNRPLAREYRRESMARIHPPKEKYLYFEMIEKIDDQREIEVVNLFPDPKGLAYLTVMANYDRETNTDNILTPFASGCQSLFSIPYHESFGARPGCVIGLMDPQARNYVPEDMLSFSMPACRFAEMANNLEGSFLDGSLNPHAPS